MSQEVRPGRLTQGYVIDGKYRIEAPIGRGGMSSVYRARHLQLDRDVAIKVLKPNSSDNKIVDRFLLEARAESALNHKNILSVHALGKLDTNQLYLVMDYLDGHPLSTILKDGPIEQSLALEIFQQICDGLSFAHKNGILHRDLKPSNIVVLDWGTDNFTVKIVDFGLAKFTASPTRADQKLTSTGTIMGTPAYMSPEQAMGFELDLRTDIYSLGCLMYETLTGCLPFSGASEFHIMARHIDDEVPPFGDVNPSINVSPDFEKIVLKAMSKESGDRQASCDELRHELGDVDLQKKYVLPAPKLSTKVLQFSKKQKLVAATVAVVGVCAAGLICGKNIGNWLIANYTIPAKTNEFELARQQFTLKSPEAIEKLIELADVKEGMGDRKGASELYGAALMNWEFADTPLRKRTVALIDRVYGKVSPDSAATIASMTAQKMSTIGHTTTAEHLYRYAIGAGYASIPVRVSSLKTYGDFLRAHQRLAESLSITNQAYDLATRSEFPDKKTTLGRLQMSMAEDYRACRQNLSAIKAYGAAAEVLPSGSEDSTLAHEKLNELMRGRPLMR